MDIISTFGLFHQDKVRLNDILSHFSGGHNFYELFTVDIFKSYYMHEDFKFNSCLLTTAIKL